MKNQLLSFVALSAMMVAGTGSVQAQNATTDISITLSGITAKGNKGATTFPVSGIGFTSEQLTYTQATTSTGTTYTNKDGSSVSLGYMNSSDGKNATLEGTVYYSLHTYAADGKKCAWPGKAASACCISYEVTVPQGNTLTINSMDYAMYGMSCDFQMMLKVSNGTTGELSASVQSSEINLGNGSFKIGTYTNSIVLTAVNGDATYNVMIQPYTKGSSSTGKYLIPGYLKVKGTLSYPAVASTDISSVLLDGNALTQDENNNFVQHDTYAASATSYELTVTKVSSSAAWVLSEAQSEVAADPATLTYAEANSVVMPSAGNTSYYYIKVTDGAITPQYYAVKLSKEAASTNANIASMSLNGVALTGELPYTVSLAKQDISVVVVPEDALSTVSYTIDGGTTLSTCALSASELTVGKTYAIEATVTAEDGTILSAVLHLTITEPTLASVTIGAYNLSADQVSTLQTTKTLTIDNLQFTKVPTLSATTTDGSDITIGDSKSEDAYVFTISAFDQEYSVSIVSTMVRLDDNRTYEMFGNATLSTDGMTWTHTMSDKYGTTTIVGATSNSTIVQQNSAVLGANGLKIGNGRSYTLTNDCDKFTIKAITFVGASNYAGDLPTFTMTTSNNTSTIITPCDNYFTNNTKEQSICFPIEGYRTGDQLTFAISKQVIVKIVVSYVYEEDVNVSAAGWASYAPTADVVIPEGVTAYYATSYNEDNTSLHLEEVTTGYIKANEGVLVKAEQGTVTFNSVKTGVATALEGNKLEGTATDKAVSTITTGTVYVLGNVNDEVGFYQFAGTTLAAHKAYLVVPAAAAAPVIRFDFNKEPGNVTSIDNVAIEETGVKTIYNLQGQKMENMAQPGLYIVNGKKMLVK